MSRYAEVIQTLRDGCYEQFGTRLCAGCGDLWPCIYWQAADAIEALEQINATKHAALIASEAELTAHEAKLEALEQREAWWIELIENSPACGQCNNDSCENCQKSVPILKKLGVL